MDAVAWIEQLARELGVAPPNEREWEAILELAGVAAHSSERKAAPVACWIAARAGRTPEEGLALARTLESPAAEGDGGSVHG